MEGAELEEAVAEAEGAREGLELIEVGADGEVPEGFFF